MEIRPVTESFAAEIGGVDLSKPLSATGEASIKAAFWKYAVLVFPDQDLTPQQHIDFSKKFGPVETDRVLDPKVTPHRLDLSFADISNLTPEGKIWAGDSRQRMYKAGNKLWHTDSSFKPIAALASLLAARIVPPVGGNTEFASARAAYAALPATRKAELEGMVVVHRMTHPDKEHDDGYRDDDKARHVVTHPLIRTNPVNGRKALYVGAHAQEIVGMPPQEGRRILDELTAFCTQPQFVYSHSWRDGDAVMWDNRCALHRATTFDKTRYKRKLHRTTIAGKSPDSAFAAMP